MDDIEAYLRQLDEIARQSPDVQSMTHGPSKPRRPVEIEGSFIGKRTLGEAPYDVAGPLSTAAQGAYDFKTAPLYAFPATAPLATALDWSEGMATGDPLQIGMSLLGMKPKTLKRLTAGAAALSASTSDAEAGSGSAIGRALDKLGFYSKALEEAKGLKQPKATVKEYYSALKGKGVKPAELKATGFDDIFKSDPDRKMAKDELVQFLEDNRVPLKETRLGEEGLKKASREAVVAHERYLDIAREHGLTRGFDPTDPATPQAVRDAFEASNAAERRYVEAMEQTDRPKYDRYTREGGQGYQEKLLSSPKLGDGYALYDADGKVQYRYPDKAAADSARAAREANGIGLPPGWDYRPVEETRYRSSHWSEPDVVAHLRTKERLTPDGKRVLHVEEIQSDWGQAGRDRGFKNPEFDAVVKDLWKAKDDWEAAQRMVNRRDREIAKEIGGHPVGEDEAAWTAYQERMRAAQDADPERQELARVAAEARQGYDALMAKRNAFGENGVGEIEPGPWVGETKDWTDLAIKKALIDAERGGYDAVTWSPGQEQADRYNLSKQVGRMNYDFGDGNLRVLSPDGYPVHTGQYTPEQLPGVIGKDNARKLLEEPTFKIGNSMHGLDGDGLSWGGEGMKTYYDKIVPSRMASLARQLDPQAELGMLPVESGHRRSPEWTAWVKNGENGPEPQQYLTHLDTPGLTLTPKMKEEIRKGLPLFVGMPVAAGSLLPGSEQPQEPQEYAGGGKVISRATSAVSDLLKKLESMGGAVEAQRLERAADEVPALDQRYKPGALLRAMDGPVTVMPGSKFEDWAYPLPEGGRFMYETDKGIEDLDGYLRHLKELEGQGGWADVPQLWMGQGPALPGIGGHEGRHRMRAIGDENGLVQVYPDSSLRSMMRDRSNSYDREAQIKSLNDYLDSKARFVTPEIREKGELRPARRFPELFADGGEVKHFDAGGYATGSYGGFADNSRPGSSSSDYGWSSYSPEARAVATMSFNGLPGIGSDVDFGGGYGMGPGYDSNGRSLGGNGGMGTPFATLTAVKPKPAASRPVGNPADIASGIISSDGQRTAPQSTLSVPTLSASAFDPTPVAQQKVTLTQPTALASVEQAAREISTPAMTLTKLAAPLSNFSSISGSAGIPRSAGFSTVSPADTSSVNFDRDTSPTFMSFDRSANPDVYDRNANTAYNVGMTESRNDVASMPGVLATLGNRALTDFGGYGTSIDDQATARNQYTGLTARNIARAQREVMSGNPAAVAADQTARRLAAQLVSGELDDPTGGARSYRVIGSPSPVHDRLERAGSIDLGRHTFSDFAATPMPVARPSEYSTPSLASLTGSRPADFGFSNMAYTGFADAQPLAQREYAATPPSSLGFGAPARGFGLLNSDPIGSMNDGGLGMTVVQSELGKMERDQLARDITAGFDRMNDPPGWDITQQDRGPGFGFGVAGMRESGNVLSGPMNEGLAFLQRMSPEEMEGAVPMPVAGRYGAYNPEGAIPGLLRGEMIGPAYFDTIGMPEGSSFVPRGYGAQPDTMGTLGSIDTSDFDTGFTPAGGKLQGRISNADVPHTMTASEYADQQAERERMAADEQAQMDPYDRAKQWLAGALGQAYAQPVNPWSGMPNDPAAVANAQAPAEEAQVAFANVPLPPSRPLDLSVDTSVDTAPRPARETAPRPPADIPNLSSVANVPMPVERPADLDSLIAAAQERSPFAPVNWGYGEKGTATNPYTRAEMAEFGLGDYDPVMDKVQKYAPRAAGFLIPAISGPYGALLGLANLGTSLTTGKSLLQRMAENPGDPTVIDMVLGRDGTWSSQHDARYTPIPARNTRPAPAPSKTSSSASQDDGGETIETVDFAPRRYVPLDDYYTYAMRPEHTFFYDR